jgi:uncharacterized protein (TIGR02466 family)
MSFIIEELFPTPIYASIISNVDEVQQEIDAVYDKVKFNEPPKHWGKTHKLSSTDTNVLDDLSLEKTKATIINAVSEYCNFLQHKVRNYRMESWFTSFSNGEYAQMHEHGFADISGVYYYKTNGEDGTLFFENPTGQSLSSLLYHKKYAVRWEHKPIVGKLLLFPAWLKHGVTTNITDSHRSSLSFNIFFDRMDNY